MGYAPEQAMHQILYNHCDGKFSSPAVTSLSWKYNTKSAAQYFFAKRSASLLT